MRRIVVVGVIGVGLAIAGCGDNQVQRDMAAIDRTPEPEYKTAEGGLPTVTKPMGFQECLATIRGAATDMATAPINIVETANLRIVRFNTSDGSVLITCNGPERKMVMIRSPHKG